MTIIIKYFVQQMLKIAKSLRTIYPSWPIVPGRHLYKFSKRLKHKIQLKQKKQQNQKNIIQNTSSNHSTPINNQVKQETTQIQSKMSKQARQQIQKIFILKYPNFRPKTRAQRVGLDINTQMIPFAILASGCVISSSEPFTDLYFYSLHAAQKLLTFLLLLNLNYGSENDKSMKYLLMGSVIVPALLLPPLSVYGFSTQIIHMSVLLTNDRQKINQNSSLTSEQKQLLKYRIKISIALAACMTAIVGFKAIYYIEKNSIAQKIEEYNQRNKLQGGVGASPRNANRSNTAAIQAKRQN